MVIGLVIHTKTTDSGKLVPNHIAAPADSTIWKGTGTQAKNRPTANAPATERRLKCQRFGSCSQSPNICNALFSFIVCGFGRKRWKNLRGMVIVWLRLLSFKSVINRIV